MTVSLGRVKTLMGVWLVYGAPQGKDGAVSYHRGCTFLMSLTAGSGDVAFRFVDECRKEDNVPYLGAKIDSVKFYGIVELPENGTASAAQPQPEVKAK